MPNFFDFTNASANPKIPSVKDITADDLNRHQDKVQVVDVRRPDEWNGEFGHIPSAELIVLDTLPMRQNELSQDKTIVFVCRSGARSAQACAWASENGFKSVYNMQGGMIAWSQSNYNTVNKNL